MSRRTARHWFATLIGFIGELLMTAGVLLLLFVVWELWWTNFDAEKAQKQATSDLFSRVDVPLDGAKKKPVKKGDLKLGAGPGEVFGVFYAPRMGSNYAVPISEGTTDEVLNTVGLGHYVKSQWPGEIGNFAVAGHRQTHGAVLWDMDKLQPGDKVYVQTLNGYFTYEVTTTKIVDPSQGEVVTSNPFNPGAPPQGSWLTLTTCHPPYTTLQRMVTHAKLVSQQTIDSGPPKAIRSVVEKTVSEAQTGIKK